MPELRRARQIAAYWPADGEIDPRPFMDSLLEQGKRGYLPVLRRSASGPRAGKLWFVRHAPGEPLRPNRFDIPEPRRRGPHIRTARQLDLILMPLVGFDPQCHRIGMGGGFYDRTLDYLRRHTHWRRPRLVGLAHECQCLDAIEPSPWDIPLDAVCTEQRVYRRSRPAGAS